MRAGDKKTDESLQQLPLPFGGLPPPMEDTTFGVPHYHGRKVERAQILKRVAARAAQEETYGLGRVDPDDVLDDNGGHAE